MVIIDESDYLAHYGTPRHSGRYPWGSSGWGKGEETSDASPRNPTFLDNVQGLRKHGLSDAEIAKGWGISTTKLRARITIANAERAQANIAQAVRLHNKGMSNVAAAKQMGVPEPTFRSWLKPDADRKARVLLATSEMLKRQVAEKKFVDVGIGQEHYINSGISAEKLRAAVAILEEEGYVTHNVPIRQLGTGKDTTTKVLAPAGTTWGDVVKNRDLIRPPTEFSDNGGENYVGIKDPISISPNRVQVRYGNEGGAEADGVLYVRRGVEDVSLDKNRYAQVRVQVGEEHYLKGMAMYKDDLPKGVDIVFNTNKLSTGNKFDAMKKLSDNSPELPFGAVIQRQILSEDKQRVTSVMNLVNEEGKWGDWTDSLASQVLSKQRPAFAKEQLDKTFKEKQKEFEEIDQLNNPTVKRELLEKFADSVDASAVDLKATNLPRQGWHVILPVESLSPNEIYAPNYDNGEKVVLIRYPHGGIFEIPELTVNNKHRESSRLLGDVPDAVGIHSSVAQRLSGADFDGDTVLVIPNNNRKIIRSRALEDLKNFDPRAEYPPYDGMRTIDGGTYSEKTKKAEFPPGQVPNDRKQSLMGEVSNLITDMTIRLAPHEHIARAVKHSMVVIDAEKHFLNHKLSYEQNGIRQLKLMYQGKTRGGASTLISLAGRKTKIDERKPRPAKQGGSVNKQTGAKEFVPSGRTTLDKSGNRVPRKETVELLSIKTDAHELSSGTPIEKIYADHSNRLKALANKARLEAVNTKGMKMSRSAKEVYVKEVESLKAKLAVSEKNAPLERQAQVLAGANVRAKRLANPNLDEDAVKKLGFAELETMRTRLGAKKKDKQIKITPDEWNAIQAGAISNHMLQRILKNTDLETIRKYATPKSKRLMSTSDTSLAKRLLASGATRAEVAKRLGVSLSTLDRSVKGEEE